MKINFKCLIGVAMILLPMVAMVTCMLVNAYERGFLFDLLKVYAVVFTIAYIMYFGFRLITCSMD